MSIKLSNTAINLYNQCSYCWYLHYKENIRPVRTSSALVFGSALDNALNELLKTKNLQDAQRIFQMEWQNYHTDENITYFKSDLDEELLEYNDTIKLAQNKEWSTLYIKGMMFIEAYYKEVLPKIKKVIAVQEPITIENAEGDKITGILDLVVEWENGKTYLMDNKSSASLYDPLSAKEGQQLPLYHYAVKDKYKLDGIGYIVLIKKINKNKAKFCKKCGIINTSSHKKCNETVKDEKGDSYGRCNGEFQITINPSVDIQYVFNTVDESDENRVLESFDNVNYAITNNFFDDKHSEIRGKYGWCPYKDYHENSIDFIKKEYK
jgi:hypothetical protein